MQKEKCAAARGDGSKRGKKTMIRTIIMLLFWAMAMPFAALHRFFLDLSYRRRPPPLSHVHLGRLRRSLADRRARRDHRPRSVRSFPQLHLHDQSRLQSRSSDSDSADSRAHLGHGEERTIQNSHPRTRYAPGLALPVDRGNRDAGIEAVAPPRPSSRRDST